METLQDGKINQHIYIHKPKDLNNRKNYIYYKERFWSRRDKEYPRGLKLDVITAINVVKNVLRDNLTDPYTYAGGTARPGDQWIFADEPHSAFKFPQIQIVKFRNPTKPISIGSNYTEYEELLLNIWVFSKNGFKIVYNGTTYTNAQFVEFELGKIKELLKSKFNEMFSSGVKNYYHLNTSNIIYDPETQLYKAYVTCRVSYFNK